MFRRHFQPELASNKLVRLIFNGQVLQQDMETLQSCGLFDNCVVHCLIHQKRAQSTENSGDASASSHYESVFNDRINSNANNNNNNNQPREWDFGNSLFAFISVILLAAWYFRLYVSAIFGTTFINELCFLLQIRLCAFVYGDCNSGTNTDHRHIYNRIGGHVFSGQRKSAKSEDSYTRGTFTDDKYSMNVLNLILKCKACALSCNLFQYFNLQVNYFFFVIK